MPSPPDVYKRQLLKSRGVMLCTQARVTGVTLSQDRTAIESVTDSQGNIYPADAFLDTTGTAGPMGNCTRYGLSLIHI